MIFRRRAPRDDSRKSVWRDGLRRLGSAAFAFGARSLQQVTTFILTLLAARFLLPAEYGVYSLSVIFVTFLQTLTYTGYFHYVMRAKGDEKELVDTCFWLILALATVGSAALFWSAPALAAWFDAPDLTLVLRLLAIIQPIAASTAWGSSVLMRRKEMNLHFSLLIAQNLFGLVSGVALMIIWPSIFALVAHRVVRAVSGVLLYLVFARLRPGLAVRWTIVRDATRYSMGLYGTRISSFLSTYGADLALGLLYSTAEAGLYRFGSRIAMGAIDIVAQPMRSFALAQLGAAHRHDQPLGPVVERFASTMFVLIGCVVGTLLVFGEDVVRLLFQPAYLDALVVTYAISIAALIGLGSTFVEPVLASAGRTGASFRYHGVWAAIQTASIPVVAQLGLGAVAWSRAAFAFATTVAGFRLMSRTTDVGMRPLIVAMRRAAVFVLAYTLLVALIRAGLVAKFGMGRSELAVELALACVVGLMTLFAAWRWRVLRLRVFSD